MRSPKILLVLGLLAAACTASVDPEATGEEIFGQICARCHGADLSGGVGPAIGPGSNATSQPDEFLTLTITRGRGRMPSFQSTLSEEQIARVVAYVRQRQGQ
jgi:mono/diheme cytochrome c family protein